MCRGGGDGGGRGASVCRGRARRGELPHGAPRRGELPRGVPLPLRRVGAAVGDLQKISGQKPIENRAKMSIANFKLREGSVIGTSVTLRGNRMWQFYDRFVNITLPRVRDFRGISRTAFDGRGNYSLGLRDQSTFPEIDYNEIDRMRGMQLTFVTSARSDEEGRRLLELLGMPFSRVDEPVGAL